MAWTEEATEAQAVRRRMMTDRIVEPEGSIHIEATHGSVTLYFVFEGDWLTALGGTPESEAEARSWFVEEVQRVLEATADEARNSDETERPSGPED